MTYPNIKFFRSTNVPSNPQEGFVWFNSANNTIQLYKNGGWEKYSGKINNVTYVDGVLTIIPHEGDSIPINLGNVANIEGLANRLGTLETNYTTLSGEFTTEKGKISTLQGEMVDVKAEVAKLEGITDKVTTYVVSKIGEEEKVRQEADQAFDGRISNLEGLVGETAVSTQITNAINDLDNGGVTGNGTFVNVTVTQVDGKVTGVSVAESNIASTSDLNIQKGRIDTLVGEGEGSIKSIAYDVLAAELLAGPDGAVDNFTTLKELAAWLEQHPEDAAAMNQSIATNTADVTTIKGQISSINDTIEKNELTVASALTDLDVRVNSKIAAVEGQSYITATTTDGAVTINAVTGSVANGVDALATASDVKTYVDSM